MEHRGYAERIDVFGGHNSGIGTVRCVIGTRFLDFKAQRVTIQYLTQRQGAASLDAASFVQKYLKIDSICLFATFSLGPPAGQPNQQEASHRKATPKMKLVSYVNNDFYGTACWIAQ